MKLTSIKRKMHYSIYSSIHHKCHIKTNNLTSFNVLSKIRNEILTPNMESIQRMRIRMLNNLQDEIN